MYICFYFSVPMGPFPTSKCPKGDKLEEEQNATLPTENEYLWMSNYSGCDAGKYIIDGRGEGND